MGDKIQRRPLSDTEKNLTKKSITQQQYNLRLLEHNKKKFLLQLEELPLIQQSLHDKLRQCDFEIETTKLAIKTGEESIEKGVMSSFHNKKEEVK